MKKKLPFIIIGIILLIAIIGSVFIMKNTNTSSKSPLLVKYVGGDKFIGQEVTNDDFEVTYIPTNTKLSSNDFLIENTKLVLDGTNVVIMYNTSEGEMIDTTIKVGPTLTITSITAELVNSVYIGSTLTTDDFLVNAIDNQGNAYPITSFNISNNKIELEESIVTITYQNFGETFTTDVVVKAGQNFFTDLDVQYVGTNNYIGQDVQNSDFIVTAIYADETKLPLENFSLASTNLTGKTTVLTVTATNEKGELITKDIEIESKNYITSIHSVMYIGDSQTVGNSVTIDDFEVYGLESDNTKTKLTEFKIYKNAKLENTINTVTISYLNEVGQLLLYDVTVNANENIIFIGDTRTKALKDRFEESSSYCYYIYNEKADLEWLKKKAIPKAQSIMNKNVYTTYRIVINIGLFDSNNINEYIKLFNSLSEDKWENHKLFIVSLNPIDELKMDNIGKYSRDIINTSKVKNFNTSLKENLKLDNKNLNYINTNGSIINQGFDTIDGINYDDSTLDYYYSLIKSLTT